jgi:transcriptional regulator with XRE-family HTH domain
MSLPVRLRQAILAKYKSIKDFCSDTGIAYRTVHGYLSGSREPDADNLAKIYAQSSINIGWLLTGKGDMFVGEVQQVSSVIPLDSAPKERIKRWLDDFWQEADPKRRAWLEMQIEDHLPQYREWVKKNEGGDQDCDAEDGVATG